MKTDEIEARDRVAQTFTGTIPDGEHNRSVEIVATESGLVIDEAITVPWGWIELSLLRMKQPNPEGARSQH